MCFSRDPMKQSQVIFSRKTIKANHAILFINGTPVVHTDIQKYLGIFLDTKLSLFNHFKISFEKTNKTTGLLRKLQLVLPRSSLLINHL